MLSLLLQAADTLQSAGSAAGDADCGSDTFGFWAGLASIVGVALTVLGLYLSVKGLRAQRAGEQAKADAEEVKRLFTRKLRLPEYRDRLDGLATRLDGALLQFPERQADVQAEAEEATRSIVTTAKHLSKHLDGEHLEIVTGLVRQIEHRAGVLNLRSGQHIKSCTRDIVLTLTLVIDDERAQSI